MTEARPPVSNHLVEFALLGLLATLWGASYTFIKVGIATIPPWLCLASRCFPPPLALVIYFRLIQTLGSTGTTAQAFLRVPAGVAIGG